MICFAMSGANLFITFLLTFPWGNDKILVFLGECFMKKFLVSLKHSIATLFCKLWGEYKFLVPVFAAVLIIYGIFFYAGISCPVKFITGISCPGCGMTRACLYALKLDFASAFAFHPLWIGLLPAIFLLAFFYLKGMSKAVKIHLVICGSVMLATYLVRMVFLNTDVVVFHPEEGVIVVFIRNLAEKIFS